MTQFLASVTGPDEALTVLAAGADIIDLKDPALGALASVAPGVLAETIEAVAGRAKISAVAGDGTMRPETLVRDAEAMRAADFVKIGIFPGDARACVRALAPVARQTRLIAVLFADRSPEFTLLEELREAGFAGAMLDTAEKGGTRLLSLMDVAGLQRFAAACRAHGLLSGLAGSLEAPDVPRLLLLQPDTLGFRGALTSGARADSVDEAAAREIRALIPRVSTGEAAPQVDYRLLAARGYAPAPESDPAMADRVYVRDLVMPFFIGTYAHERAAPQKVRIEVSALVSRIARASADMRDVFSYDVITDSARLLAASGHFPLVETLAERLAEAVLAHGRVVKVTVLVEKLETGAGVVGVEIERERDVAVAAAPLAIAARP
jgi:dihydroneopterin aldolase